jgi:hypothetical protein
MAEAEKNMFLLYLHDASDEHREAVQQIVKTHADGWAHHLPDLWLAEGHDHKYWGDLIAPVLALSEAGLLVFELPRERDHRMFATRGKNPNHMLDWLWSTYYGKPRPGAVKPAEDKKDLSKRRPSRT